MVLGLLNQLMIVGELWTAGASHAGDSFSLSLRKMGTPRLAMRMGEVHVDVADQRDTHMIRLEGDVYFG